MTTYYVSPIGSDANSGLTPALAWLTLAHAAATATTGGDIVNVMSGFVPTGGTINFNATYTGVSASAPITFQGADGAGVPLTTGTIPIDGTSMSAGVDIFTLTTTNLYINFKRFEFTLARRYGVISGTNGYFPVFTDCRFDNCVNAGLDVVTTQGLWTLINCELDNNGGGGFKINIAGRGNVIMRDLLVHDNTGIGLQVGGDTSGGVSISRCQVYGNTSHGIQLLSFDAKVEHNTIFNNGGSGIDNGSSTLSIIRHNTLVNNAAFGLDLGTGTIRNRDYNHYQGNTTAAISGSAALGANSITGAPAFTNTTAGSEDFTPLDTSVLRRAGVNNIDIGAIAANVPAGGGGAIVNQGLHAIDSGITA